MAKKFKDYYDYEYGLLIADKIKGVLNTSPTQLDFEYQQFLDYTALAIPHQEFLERQDTFAKGFDTYISGSYVDKLILFSKILGPTLKQETGMFIEGWWLWPIGRFVQMYNDPDYIDQTLDFIYQLTQRFTGEFAVRPLFEIDTPKVMKQMLIWSTDPSVHVRRLSSEGIRISLPWANKTLTPLKEFELYTQILTNLRHDPSKFVQKSVGNALNDLMKYDASLANQIINSWNNTEPSKPMEWIIKHGSRSLK